MSIILTIITTVALILLLGAVTKLGFWVPVRETIKVKVVAAIVTASTAAKALVARFKK